VVEEAILLLAVDASGAFIDAGAIDDFTLTRFKPWR
jgi:hypothetical protein